MAAHGDERETYRILRTVNLAFGNAARSNVLELDRGQQVTRVRTGSVSVVFGIVLGLVAAAGLGLAASHQPLPAPRPVEQDVGGAKPFATPAPKVVATDAASPPVPRRPSTADQARFSYADLTTRPPNEPEVAKAGSTKSRYIADPLTGDALRRALIEDRLRTRELNTAELERLEDRT